MPERVVRLMLRHKGMGKAAVRPPTVGIANDGVGRALIGFVLSGRRVVGERCEREIIGGTMTAAAARLYANNAASAARRATSAEFTFPADMFHTLNCSAAPA